MENEGLRTRHTNAPMRPPPFLLQKKTPCGVVPLVDM